MLIPPWADPRLSEELPRLRQRGEGQEIEFKENMPVQARDLATEIAAFASSNDGLILVGVSDDGSLIGLGDMADVRDRDRWTQRIAGVCRDIRPPVTPSVSWAVEDGRAVLVVRVPRGDEALYYVNHRAYVRRLSVSRPAEPPEVTAAVRNWLTRNATGQNLVPASDPSSIALVARVRRVFAAHGVEPAHMKRFLSQTQAPFTIEFPDLQSDSAFLNWITEEKLDWVARVFRVRREWIDGEDEQVHERPYFDKQPDKFFQFVSMATAEYPLSSGHRDRHAYFIRCGAGRSWKKNQGGDVLVVLALPLARLSDERTVYRYISDLSLYPWEYERTSTQLRAWARLLFVNLGFTCWGRAANPEVVERLHGNTDFLGPMLGSSSIYAVPEWHPEDYGLYESESPVAKEGDSMELVENFLRRHGLPCAPGWKP